MGPGTMKFTIYVPLTPQILHTKFGEKKSNSFKEEVENVQKFTTDDGQTHDARRRTDTDSNRSPE